MVLDTLDAQREPLAPPATGDLPQAAATTNSNQQQIPPLERPAQVPLVNVHATAYLSSSALERKFDELVKTIKQRPRPGLDGSFAFSGSVCVGITLYCLFNGMKPTCNCTCPASTVVCSFPTPRPTPLTMDNGTMHNSTQTNMTADANGTMPSSTSGFMQMLSTLVSANSSNDTMPTLAPTTHAKRNKLKED